MMARRAKSKGAPPITVSVEGVFAEATARLGLEFLRPVTLAADLEAEPGRPFRDRWLVTAGWIEVYGTGSTLDRALNDWLVALTENLELLERRADTHKPTRAKLARVGRMVRKCGFTTKGTKGTKDTK
ncbi:MAG TPA: hypothetical protein VM487_17305 [Phycisphaerae bacterium]|nr:hypothetical protein [Phycisphaerae bacterium]